MLEWSYEKADEDEPYAAFYIKHKGKTVATTLEEDWARIIVAACNRDIGARLGNFTVAEDEIKF